MRTIEIDTAAKLDYSFDWSDWLKDGDSIQSFEFLNVPAGITISDTSESGGIVIFWATQPTQDKTHLIRCHIVTVQGREDTRSLTLVGRLR